MRCADQRALDSDYVAPWWLPGGHLQTIYARALAHNYRVGFRRERWITPDDDFIDLDWLAGNGNGRNLVVLFHGLEGGSQSHYALALMEKVRANGWRGVVPHFRGCSGEANRLLRSYHSGDSREIDWILRRLKAANPSSRIYVVAVSLGGNMMLKWLGEEGEGAAEVIERAVAVSTPLDLVAAAGALDFGVNRILYTRYFLRSLRPRALAKIAAHELAINAQTIRASRTFRQFDNIFTAPIHGFKDANDYWTRCSSKPWLKNIQVPTLLINARNDPFLPESALPTVEDVSDFVARDFPRSGGHVGFVTGEFPGKLGWLPDRVINFFSSRDDAKRSLSKA